MSIPKREKMYTKITTPYSAIVLNSFPNYRREKHTQIGMFAQQELAKRLSDVYGKRSVSMGLGFGSLGTNSEPDLLLKFKPHPIAIELKSVQTFTVRNRKVYKNAEGERYKRARIVPVPRLGTSKGFIQSWYDFTSYATSHLMHRIYVIEFRREGARSNPGQAGYMWMGGEVVDKIIEEVLQRKGSAKVFHIGLWDMMYKGNVMKFEEGEFEPWLNVVGAVVSSQTQIQ